MSPQRKKEIETCLSDLYVRILLGIGITKAHGAPLPLLQVGDREK